jgi:UDP-3-O-[3-hydroxymyristoyl] N-acetylglucosamine deacetylase
MFEEERVLDVLFAKQHTIDKEVFRSGVGLHSGAKVTLRLKPAPTNFGIRFRRTDVAKSPLLTAHYRNVTDTSFATSIGSNGTAIRTVEHLMAALLGGGVDNILVELDGPEVPIFDGSAVAFMELLEEAGLKKQQAPRRFLKVKRSLLLRDADAYVKVNPSDHFRMCYTIDYPHPLIGKQELAWCFEEGGFAQDIARARTFGFLKDVQKLQSIGLAQGGSLANAVVFDDYGLLNSDGLRFMDECVRHKILDFLGDLALAGMPLLGNFEIRKAGHTLHNRFLKHLMARPSYYVASVPAFLTPPFFQTPSFSSFAEPIPLTSKCV